MTGTAYLKPAGGLALAGAIAVSSPPMRVTGQHYPRQTVPAVATGDDAAYRLMDLRYQVVRLTQTLEPARGA